MLALSRSVANNLTSPRFIDATNFRDLMTMQLVIGNKNYSTWSLRPWLMMSYFGIDFEEHHESLREDQLSKRLSQYSPSSKVPVLIDGEIVVWDSLAICEYVNERYLDGKAWPSDTKARATARAVTAEMHSSFAAMRNELPMNCRARRHVDLSEAAQRDVAYIDALWTRAIEQSGGPWLFGDFCIADCFYAPVVMRFYTYDITSSPASTTYAEHVRSNPHMQRWIDDALAESEIVDVDEAGVEVPST